MATYPAHGTSNWDPALRAYIDQGIPAGSGAAGQLPYRDTSNQLVWTDGTHVVAQSLGWKIATDPAYGADPTGAADATTALQNCANDAAAAGQTFYAEGTFKISGTITITGDADLHRATFNYTPTGAGGIALQVGDPAAQFFRGRVLLPAIINTAKTATGWAQTGVTGSVGVRLSNCYACSITLPRINNFETGLRVHGVPVSGTIQGTQHTSIYPLHLDNNKVNLHVAPFVGTVQSDSGWANQCYVWGGRLSHNSNEGSQVSGTRNVLIENDPNIVNGWTFFGTSLESPDVVEYHIETWSQYCMLINCRFENTGGDAHRRVATRGSAKNNWIIGGFNAGQITPVKDSTAMPFRTVHDAQLTAWGGSASAPPLIIENLTSATAPSMVIMAAGATQNGDSPATAYAVTASSQSWRGKRPTDTNDRLIMDYLDGRVYVGDGTFAPAGYLSGSASGLFVGGSVPLFPLVTNTQDLGLSTLKWRYVRAGTAVQTGAVATGSRPAASTAGAGAMVYDTTLKKPIWSDGSSWRDATGTVV